MASASIPPDESECIRWRVVVFTAVFVPIQVLAVALRYFTKWLIQRPWGWDDVFVFASVFFQLVMAGIGIGSIEQESAGYHTEYIRENFPDSILDVGRYLFAISTIYLFTVNIPKLAILILYRRFFASCRVRVIIYILMVVLVGASVANTTAALASCRPFSANWDLDASATCTDRQAFFIWSSIPNIATGLVILILPLPTIWRLQMDNSMKAGLKFTFIVGSLGLVTSILRFKFLFQTNTFMDGPFTDIELMIWSEAEPGICLVCACLLTYRPLLQKAGLGKLGEIAKGKKSDQMDGQHNGDQHFAGVKGKGMHDAFGDDTMFKGMLVASVTSGGRQTPSERWSHSNESGLKYDNRITVRTDIRIESGVGNH